MSNSVITIHPIAPLKNHLEKDFLNLRLGRLAVLSNSHRNSRVDHRLQIIVRRGFEAYVHPAISNLYFFALRIRATKSPMLATLRMDGKPGKRADCVSQAAAACMHSASVKRHSVGANAALGVPHQHSVDTSDVGVGRVVKGFVSQAYRLVEKSFMVHRWIMSGLGLDGHSYFPFGWYVAIVRNMNSNRIQFDLHEVEPA